VGLNESDTEEWFRLRNKRHQSDEEAEIALYQWATQLPEVDRAWWFRQRNGQQPQQQPQYSVSDEEVEMALRQWVAGLTESDRNEWSAQQQQWSQQYDACESPPHHGQRQQQQDHPQAGRVVNQHRDERSIVSNGRTRFRGRFGGGHGPYGGGYGPGGFGV
jgi:hypothetical protein